MRQFNVKLVAMHCGTSVPLGGPSSESSLRFSGNHRCNGKFYGDGHAGTIHLELWLEGGHDLGD